MVTVISLLRVRSRSRLALRRAGQRSGLPLRFFLIYCFLRSVFCSRTEMDRVSSRPVITPSVPDVMISRKGFGFLMWCRPAPLQCPGRIQCLLTSASLYLHFPRRCCLLALAIRANGSRRRLKKAGPWTWSKALLLTDHITPAISRPCPSFLVVCHTRFTASFRLTPAGRQHGEITT